MRENYNFEYWKNDKRRLQFSVIRGISYRYLWHEEVELMLPLSGELEYFAGERHYHLKIEVFPHQQLTSTSLH